MKRTEEKEYIHMSCLGLLCEPFSSRTNGKATFHINKVTCPKCLEIMKKQRIYK